MKTDIIYNMDCLEGMKQLPSSSIDMVFTSPPYADRRKSTYGGLSSDEYIDWFLPISAEIKRILKPSGSFFMNIKPHTDNGERSLYVFELVMKIRNEVGFKFIDEICWTKNAFPGKFYGRLKNGFEPVYHFTIDSPSNITFNPSSCGEPLKKSSIVSNPKKKSPPKNGSGMTRPDSKIINGLKTVLPSNVINIHNVLNQFSKNKGHPATFPVKLVDFFVKIYTNSRDIVLDPFMGSGTTAVSCKSLNRQYIGYEMMKEYYDISQRWLNEPDEVKTLKDNDFFD